jgi:hypothetical protein
MERRFEPEALEQARLAFTWGPHDTAALRAGRPEHAHRFVMTGSPRVDLWRPDLAGYHALLPLPAAPDAPFVLFANNFNHHLGVNRFATMLRDKRGKYFDGFDDEKTIGWRLPADQLGPQHQQDDDEDCFDIFEHTDSVKLRFGFTKIKLFQVYVNLFLSVHTYLINLMRHTRIKSAFIKEKKFNLTSSCTPHRAE